ncbi:MAG: amino acid ABC transporter substrate-binding protein [Anaerovorax sp.]
MKKKVSLLLALMLIISVFAVGCGKDEPKKTEVDTSLTDLQSKGTLVVGCDDQFPPMGFVGEDGKLTGFDIELAALVGEKLGVKTEPMVIDWAAKEMELNNGNIDVIWNGYTITKERNAKVEYTKPYLNNEQVIVTKADSDIKTKADLVGKNLGAQVDSSGLAALQGDKAIMDGKKSLTEYDTYMLALTDLQSDRLDAVVIDKVLINYVMTKEEGKYKVLEESMGDELYGIGCASGSVALREAIDKALDELYEDGSIETLCNKWFGENIVIRDVEKLTDADLQ